MSTKGTLNDGEPHPAAHDAMAYVKSHSVEQLMNWREAFASCSIEGNRAGEICGETLDRIMNGEPVSDRYLLGLAWTIRKSEI